jgi:hypothetical protein
VLRGGTAERVEATRRRESGNEEEDAGEEADRPPGLRDARRDVSVAQNAEQTREAEEEEAGRGDDGARPRKVGRDRRHAATAGQEQEARGDGEQDAGGHRQRHPGEQAVRGRPARTRPAGSLGARRLPDEAREQRDAEELGGEHADEEEAGGDVEDGAPPGEAGQGAQRVGTTQHRRAERQDDDQRSTATLHLAAHVPRSISRASALELERVSLAVAVGFIDGDGFTTGNCGTGHREKMTTRMSVSHQRDVRHEIKSRCFCLQLVLVCERNFIGRCD